MTRIGSRAAVAAAAMVLLTMSARAGDKALSRKPYLGWSSWSLQATRYPGYGGDWLNAANIKAQADVMHRRLQKHGYTYVNIDSGWRGGWDEYGRPTPNLQRFPEGIAGIARYVHAHGLKLGIYYVPGIDDDLLQKNPPIRGTKQRIADIVFHPSRVAHGWGGGNKIDFSKPGAQAYINSIADLFAEWKIDFLKFDGVTPGSEHYDLKIDGRPDVEAWGKALQQVKRPIWLTISWRIDMQYAEFWRQHANAWRTDSDVETYGPTLTGWEQVSWRFGSARRYAGFAGPDRGWNDMDSLPIGNGAMSGLTRDERRTMMTLWAISCSPLYIGDDLTKLDDTGMELLTNDEVIAANQSGNIAVPVSGEEGKAEVWRAKNADGSLTVALFNRDAKATLEVRADWKDLGLSGPATVRDLWGHRELGSRDGGFTALLAPHACRLVKMIPQPAK